MSAPKTKEYLKKNASAGELFIYRVLNSAVLQAYNDDFSTLVLPRATAIDTIRQQLRLPYYEGQTFDDVWDVSNGGSPMGLSLAKEIPLVLRDLAMVDPMHILKDGALAGTSNIAFEHTKAAPYFYSLATKLQQAGPLPASTLGRIRALLDLKQTTAMIVSNGDFYPRNLIKMPGGKVVLIDWETWNSHSPFFVVDHPENVAAVQYVHMWGNPEWQAAYLAELDRHFSFSADSLRKGIVMKALTLAEFFPQHQQLFQGQIDILCQVTETQNL